MNRYPYPQQQPPQHPIPQQPLPPPPRPRTRRRLRLWIFIVPLTCAAFIWIADGVTGTAISWREFLVGTLGLERPDRFTRLAALGVLLVGVLLILRVLGWGHEEE